MRISENDDIESLAKIDPLEITKGVLISDDDDFTIDIDIDNIDEDYFSDEEVNNNSNTTITMPIAQPTTFGGATPTGAPFSTPTPTINTASNPWSAALATPSQPATTIPNYFGVNTAYQRPTVYQQNWYNPAISNNTYVSNVNIDFRNKKILFCSLYDTIICSNYSWQNNTFIPNTPINNITDIYIRREVLDKLKRFIPDLIYVIAPRQFFIQLANSTSLELRMNRRQMEEDINSLTGYLRMYISSYLRLSTSKKCQFISFDDMDYRSVSATIIDTIKNLNAGSNNNYPDNQIGYIGAFSGNNGYNPADAMIAEAARIEFIDTNILLRC